MSAAVKLLPATAAAIAAMAIGAGSASASAAVEITNEATGAHCGAVSLSSAHEPTGGCEIEVTGTWNLYAHVGTSEVLFSGCSQTLEGNINEEGSGFITHQQLSGGSCGLEPCDEATGDPHPSLPWPVKSAELFPGHEVLGLLFCVRPISAGEGNNSPPCALVIDIVDEGDHEYALEANGVPCLEAGSTEFHGSWTITGTPIEIGHL